MEENKFAKVEQKRKKEIPSHSAAGKMVEHVSEKKLVTFKASADVYKKFTFINKKKGLSNTAVLNMCILQYIEKNEEFL